MIIATKTKIIKLKKPLSPHPKITLPFDFNFYLINLMKETIILKGEARDF